jgi:methyl-accepting chemotaxis protein
MMMFTRLKHRPIETILLFVTFNLVAVILIGIKSIRISPEIVGFSIAAALAATIAIIRIATKFSEPLARLARQANDADASVTELDIADQQRQDDLGHVARAITRMKGELRARGSEQTASVARLEESMRRLSNGDLNCLLYVSFPQHLEGLRAHLNRLVSMLNVNLSAVHGSIANLREQARSSQADLAVIAERLRGALPTAHKATGAIDVLYRSARLRNDDAVLVNNRLKSIEGSDIRLKEKAEAIIASNDATSLSLDELARIGHSIGSLAIKAEQLSVSLQDRSGSAPGDKAPTAPDTLEAERLCRELANECMQAARAFLTQCRAAESNLSDGTRAARGLALEASHMGSTIQALADPAERMARNSELELQRISLAHLAANETEAVLERSREIVEATEGAMIRMMGEASSMETRLSVFTPSAPDQSGRPSAGAKPNLRCVT